MKWGLVAGLGSGVYLRILDRTLYDGGWIKESLDYSTHFKVKTDRWSYTLQKSEFTTELDANALDSYKVLEYINAA